MLGSVVRWCFLRNKGPGSYNIGTYSQTNNNITNQEHWIVGSQTDNQHTNHVKQQCIVVNKFTTIFITQLTTNKSTKRCTTCIGGQCCQKAHLHTAHAQIFSPHTQTGSTGYNRSCINITNQSGNQCLFPG